MSVLSDVFVYFIMTTILMREAESEVRGMEGQGERRERGRGKEKEEERERKM